MTDEGWSEEDDKVLIKLKLKLSQCEVINMSKEVRHLGILLMMPSSDPI